MKFRNPYRNDKWFTIKISGAPVRFFLRAGEEIDLTERFGVPGNSLKESNDLLSGNMDDRRLLINSKQAAYIRSLAKGVHVFDDSDSFFEFSAATYIDVYSWNTISDVFDDNLYAVATDTNGQVYVGGGFKGKNRTQSKFAFSVNSASTIDTLISSVSAAPNKQILAHAIDASTGTVWIGGNWDTIGDAETGKVAYLTTDASPTWKCTSVANPEDAQVNTMAYINGVLWVSYEGGKRVANWNGSAWSSPLGAFGASVWAIKTADTITTYVGGAFRTVSGGTVNAKGIAKWDGLMLTEVGGGLSGSTGDGIVYSIATNGSDVYVGGDFEYVSGDTVSAGYVAKWDGNSWSSLGGGLNGIVRTLMFKDGVLYAGGQFTGTYTGSTKLNYIAKWNGSSWTSLGSGLNNIVYSIADGKETTVGETLVAGGNFTYEANTTNELYNLAKWNGTSWSKAIDIKPSKVNSVEVYNNELYAFGNFEYVGGTPINGIAKLSGNTFVPVTNLQSTITGSTARVEVLTFSGSDLYIGGTFTGKICKLDNSGSVSKFNGGFDDVVYEIIFQDNDVYVGGDFDNASDDDGATYGISTPKIARWDGSSWNDVGGGLDGTVYSATIMNDDLYVGGYFTSASAGTFTTNYIAKWDGSTWSEVGGGMDYYVYDLQVVGTDLYAGGYFLTASGGTINTAGIAKWDGNTWTEVGGGVNGVVWALNYNNSALYMVGDFTLASGGTYSVNRVAKYQDSMWYPLGDETNNGVNGISNAIAYDTTYSEKNRTQYVVGNFTTIDGNTKTSKNYGGYLATRTRV